MPWGDNVLFFRAVNGQLRDVHLSPGTGAEAVRTRVGEVVRGAVVRVPVRGGGVVAVRMRGVAAPLRVLAQLGQPDQLLVQPRVLLDLVPPPRDLHLDAVLNKDLSQHISVEGHCHKLKYLKPF